MSTMRESLCDRIIAFGEHLGWPAILPKRAWSAYKDFHAFECSQGAGFSGSAKLHAAYSALHRARKEERLDEWRGRTVGEMLDALDGLGFLAPVSIANRMARMVGLPPVGSVDIFGESR